MGFVVEVETEGYPSVLFALQETINMERFRTLLRRIGYDYEQRRKFVRFYRDEVDYQFRSRHEVIDGKYLVVMTANGLDVQGLYDLAHRNVTRVAKKFVMNNQTLSEQQIEAHLFWHIHVVVSRAKEARLKKWRFATDSGVEGQYEPPDAVSHPENTPRGAN